MFINVRPIQKEPVKWPWKNVIKNGYPFVVESPGKVEMPNIIEPFNWDMFEYNGITDIPLFGTKDMKSVFTTYCRFMGTEQAFVNIVNGEVGEDLEEITAHFKAWNSSLLWKSKVKLNYFMIGDDIGFNGGLLISPGLIRQYLLKNWNELYDLARENGIYSLVFHSDGDIMSILPDLYDIGVTHLLYEPIGQMRFIEPYTTKGGMEFIPVIHHDNEPFAGYMPEGDRE